MENFYVTFSIQGYDARVYKILANNKDEAVYKAIYNLIAETYDVDISTNVPVTDCEIIEL